MYNHWTTNTLKLKLIIYSSIFVIPTDIRHPEELSLLRPLEEKKKKKDKDVNEEIYDLCEVPLSSGTLITLHSLFLEKIFIIYFLKALYAQWVYLWMWIWNILKIKE